MIWGDFSPSLLLPWFLCMVTFLFLLLFPKPSAPFAVILHVRAKIGQDNKKTRIVAFLISFCRSPQRVSGSNNKQGYRHGPGSRELVAFVCRRAQQKRDLIPACQWPASTSAVPALERCQIDPRTTTTTVATTSLLRQYFSTTRQTIADESYRASSNQS